METGLSSYCPEMGDVDSWYWMLKAAVDHTPTPDSVNAALQDLNISSSDRGRLKSKLDEYRAMRLPRVKARAISKNPIMQIYEDKFYEALYLYTIQEPVPLFHHVNCDALNDVRGRVDLGKPSYKVRRVLPLVKLWIVALDKLPHDFHFTGEVYRFIPYTFTADQWDSRLLKDRIFGKYAFVSTASTQEGIKNFAGGKETKGERTVFRVHTHGAEAFSLQIFSELELEDEVLMKPLATLKVGEKKRGGFNQDGFRSSSGEYPDLVEFKQIPAPARLLSLVTLGCTGAGKSATANSIASRIASSQGDQPHFVFKEGGRFASETQDVKVEALPWQQNAEHAIVRLVDTPGYMDSEHKDAENNDKLANCMKQLGECQCLLLVFNSAECRMNSGLKIMLEHFRKMFGDTFLRHVVIAFTKWSFDARSVAKRARNGCTEDVVGKEVNDTFRNIFNHTVDIPCVFLDNELNNTSIDDLQSEYGDELLRMQQRTHEEIDKVLKFASNKKRDPFQLVSLQVVLSESWLQGLADEMTCVRDAILREAKGLWLSRYSAQVMGGRDGHWAPEGVMQNDIEDDIKEFIAKLHERKPLVFKQYRCDSTVKEKMKDQEARLQQDLGNESKISLDKKTEGDKQLTITDYNVRLQKYLIEKHEEFCTAMLSDARYNPYQKFCLIINGGEARKGEYIKWNREQEIGYWSHYTEAHHVYHKLMKTFAENHRNIRLQLFAEDGAVTKKLSAGFKRCPNPQCFFWKDGKKIQVPSGCIWWNDGGCEMRVCGIEWDRKSQLDMEKRSQGGTWYGCGQSFNWTDAMPVGAMGQDINPTHPEMTVPEFLSTYEIPSADWGKALKDVNAGWRHGV